MNALTPNVHPLRRLWLGGATSFLLVALAGCGGGAYVEIPFEGPPPEIALAAAPSPAYRGETVQLVAAVTAANGVDTIDFYRIDHGLTTAIGRIRSGPYQWTTTIPVNAGSRVGYYANVCDYAGLCTSSTLVTVDVYL